MKQFGGINNTTNYEPMNLRDISATVISVLICAVAFIWFAIKISSISVSDDKSEFESAKLTDVVKVYKNQYGVPHIIAKNENDAFFMAGYCHAQDRLFQMDLARRTAHGTLSEIYGAEALSTDKIMRAIDFDRIADRIWAATDAHTKSILESYTDGVNAYLDYDPDKKIVRNQKIAFEFGALGYTPEKWKPKDCLLISRLFAFEESAGFPNDVIVCEVAEKVGVKKALDLMPGYPLRAPHVLDDSGYVHPNTDTLTAADSLALTASAGERELFEGLDYLREKLGIRGSAVGSNTWASKKNKSKPGSGAVLAGDPHMTCDIPAKWYEIHITCPEFNAVGLSIPGIPFLYMGRNDAIGWTAANVMADDFDFYIERLSQKDTNYYLTPVGDSIKFKWVSDTINVQKDKKHIYYTRYAKRSAVLSDFPPPQSFSSTHLRDRITPAKSDFFNKYILTYSWTGTNATDEMTALYKILKARNWTQFTGALASWGAPALNFTYADKSGNIGLISAGIIPIREPNCLPNIPNPGFLPGYGWSGTRSLGETCKIFNPKKNYVLAANNKLFRDESPYVSAYWEPHSRAERIDSLLGKFAGYDDRDARQMQTDFLSQYSADLLAHIIPILDRYKAIYNETESNAFTTLKFWDNIMTGNQSAPTIYSEFFQKLAYNTFSDELGDELYERFASASALPLRKLLEIYSAGKSEWSDDIRTIAVETPDDIAYKSWREAVKSLADRFDDSNPDHWLWSKLHTISLRSALHGFSFVSSAVEQGPFPIGGDNTTINNTEYRIGKSYEAVTGASARFVADMEDTVVHMVVPGGASAEPLSANYSDQVQLWLNGGYVKTGATDKPGENFKLAIVGKPKKK